MNENINDKDFENNQRGEISGFDSVNGNETSNGSAGENQGYTVTPDGGFYTKSRNDIIQDDISPNYGTAAEESTERHQNSEPHRSAEQNTGANFRHGGFTQNSTAGYNYGNANYYAKKPKKLVTELVVLIPITLGVTFSATASTTDSTVLSTFILTLLPVTPDGGAELLLPTSVILIAAIPLTAPITAASNAAAATMPAP